MGAPLRAVAFHSSDREEQSEITVVPTTLHPPENIRPLQILKNDTVLFGLAAAGIVGVGAAWGWMVIQFFLIFIQPELNGLREQVGTISVF